MSDPNIQFEEDASLSTRRLQQYRREQQESQYPKMTGFVMRKIHVNEKVAQIILLAVAGIFFASAIVIFVTRFIF